MWFLLLSIQAFAEQPPSNVPQATATITTDGQYTLRLVPEVSWLSAEITISGAGSTDVGPATADDPIEIEGWTASLGTMNVQVMAVTPGDTGVTWVFEVEPEVVPATQPDMTGKTATKRKPKWWPF